MATYTLTLTLNPDDTVVNYWIYSQNCQTPLFVVDPSYFGYEYDEICSWLQGYHGGTCTYVESGTTVTFTFTTPNDPIDSGCGELISVVFEMLETSSSSNYFRTSAWTRQVETTPCPNCQPLSITNCGPVEISLPLPDDDYTVTLYDNQTGVSYEQNVQWTAGTGTWNTTNTAGVFTPFNIFTLTVTDSEGEPVSWPMGPNEYTCARVTFSATIDTNFND